MCFLNPESQQTKRSTSVSPAPTGFLTPDVIGGSTATPESTLITTPNFVEEQNKNKVSLLGTN